MQAKYPNPFIVFCQKTIPLAFDESMSYMEALYAFKAYLENEIVPTVNTNGQAVQDLTNLVNQLQDYVEHYFDNLDVQEEINNKLDEMASDGTLQEIITTYIQSNVTWTFDTVSDMQNSTNLIDGSYARTLGYYAVNDGGGATYTIRTKEISDIESTTKLFIGDDLVAELCITNNTIHSKQYGLKGDGVTNETTLLNSFFDEYKSYDIVVDSGVYAINNTLIIGGIWRQQTGNNGIRKITFQKASILYSGSGSYAVLIHSMYKHSLSGLTICETSSTNCKVALIGCWFNDYSDWFVKSLELSNDGNIASGVSLTTRSLEYLSFKSISVMGNLTIKTLDDPDGSFINSINFYNCNISSNDLDYCVIFDGNRSKQGINFYNCDISYPDVAVFNVAKAQNGRGTVNLVGCYLDSNKKIFNNDNKNNLEFNIILSSIPATSNEEIFNVKYSDFTKNTLYGGYSTHGYNLATGNINYSINGNMESTSEVGGGNALMGDTYGDWAKETVSSNLSITGNARKITLQRTATNPHLTVKGITAPRTGKYCAYMRFKIVSGSCDSVSIQFASVYSGIDANRFNVGDEIVLIHDKPVDITAGGSLDFTFYFIGTNISSLAVEFYEVGVTDGKTYIPNAPLHTAAKIE